MHISRLQIRHFRNLKNIDISASEACNVFCGKNAQGKTNLLESISLLSGNRSRRSAHYSELVQFGECNASVNAEVITSFFSFDSKVTLGPNGLRYLLSDKRVSAAKMGDDGIKAIMFTPDDLQIPKGSPSDRRRLIDQSMAVLYPEYKKILVEYDRVLKQRNTLLKRRRDMGPSGDQVGSTEALLTALDQQLASRAARIIIYRRRFIEHFHVLFAESYKQIATISETTTLTYQCKHVAEDLLDEAEIMSSVLLQLAERIPLDTIRATTSIGPHRDDFCFEISGRDAKKFASQGQIRCIMLAYKIAQINDMFERHGEYPVLLLDDMSSELDQTRNDFLHRYISEVSCQVFLTTTRPDILPESMRGLTFNIEDGAIKAMAV